MKDIVINGLAVIGAVSCLNWMFKFVRDWTARGGTAPDSTADSIPESPADEDIAAIAAAVYAILGPHRIVDVKRAEPRDHHTAAIAAAICAVMDTPHRIVHIGNADEALLH